MHRQPGKQDPVAGLQRYAHRLQRRRDAVGAGGRPAGHQVYVCLPCGAQRHPEQRPQQPEGCPGLRDPLPLQRVHQGHHPVRHLRGGVLRRQVPRQRFQHCGAVHVQKGRRAADRLHPQRAEGTAGAVRGVKPLPKLSLENTVYSLYNRTILSNKYTFCIA